MRAPRAPDGKKEPERFVVGTGWPAMFETPCGVSPPRLSRLGAEMYCEIIHNAGRFLPDLLIFV
jgi:hypothetical protein